MSTLSITDFQQLDLRVGSIIAAEPFPEAKKPAYKLTIDFGPLGSKTSSAQITDHYDLADLVGKQVVAVLNFPPRRVADYTSEVLVLGAMVSVSDVVLLQPDQAVANGTRIA